MLDIMNQRQKQALELIDCVKYLGVRMAMPSNVTTASSPPAPTSAIDMIRSRKT